MFKVFSCTEWEAQGKVLLLHRMEGEVSTNALPGLDLSLLQSGWILGEDAAGV